MLNKEHAVKIKKKLKAKINKKIKGRPHELWEIYFDGRVIAQFGIRRGSNKHAGHGHIPEQLYVNEHYCKRLAECHISRDEWIEEMQRLGNIN